MLRRLVWQIVSVRIYPERIELVAHDAVGASHARSFDRSDTFAPKRLLTKMNPKVYVQRKINLGTRTRP